MEVDPVAVHEYARVNEAAAAALESIAFPAIGPWHGIAGTLFQARVRALEKRRNELKSAHTRAGLALRTFAVVAEQTQQDMRYRQSQRADAVDRRVQIDASSFYTTDPGELRRLQHERDNCERDIRTADHAHAKAEKTLTDAERRCAHDIECLGQLSVMEPLAERIENLSLKAFMAYKALVQMKIVSREGLNWTSDGCSDHGRVTGDVALPACELHDFDYRNDDKTRDPQWLDKQKADIRFGKEVVRDSVAKSNVVSVLVGGPTEAVRTSLIFFGVEVGGTPDAKATDDRKKDKTKSRDK
jgi:hypothetical protein